MRRGSRSVFRLQGGGLLVPVEEEQPAGGCAIGMREIEPGAPEHDAWARRPADEQADDEPADDEPER